MPTTPRAEDFPGQHLVVTPLTLIRQAERSAAFGGWIVTASGCFPTAPEHLVRRPQGTPDWIVILCRSGAGRVSCGELESAIQKDELILLPPGVPHEYGADARHPWAIEWLHLRGAAADGFCAALAQGRRAALARLPSAVAAQSRIHAVWERLEQLIHLDDLLVASADSRLALAHFWAGLRRHPASGGEERILHLLKSLKSRLDTPADLSALARQCGYAPSHFSYLFRRATGLAPLQYLHSLKMREACRLLDSTPLSIQEIAGLLGYEDPFYFSRYFRKTMGSSPRDYRNRPKG
jgi:AraC family transcriptional regulator of arabinose operon